MEKCILTQQEIITQKNYNKMNTIKKLARITVKKGDKIYSVVDTNGKMQVLYVTTGLTNLDNLDNTSLPSGYQRVSGYAVHDTEFVLQTHGGLVDNLGNMYAETLEQIDLLVNNV